MKIKSNLKNLVFYFIVVALVSFIFFLSLKIMNVFPFGNIELAKCDGLYQYKAILYNFVMSIKEGTIKSFNFFNGLGNPTIFNYLYYLASPINLVGIFFNNPDSIYLSVIFVKTLFTSICALFYFRKRLNNNIFSLICSLSYTFCGWYLAYYFNMMWLDSFMIFPLLQYGLEELMENNKCYVYIFSLAYIMISNFYMAFMICIYIFIYYMFNIIIKKDKYINKIKNFQLIMFSTIITCLLCSFTIYATYASFLKMGIYVNSPDIDLTYLTVFGFIKSLFCGNVSTNISLYDEVVPNISVNIIFLISLLYFFINKDIRIKDKIITFISLVFIIIVISSKQMNYLINCFHMPVSYNFRYSFIVCFYILMIFIKNYKTFNGMIDFKVYFINFLLAILLVINFCLGNISLNIFIFNMVFLISYTILIVLYSKNVIYKVLFLMVTVIELIVGFSMVLDNNHVIREYEFNHKGNIENRTYLSSGLLVNDNLYSFTNTIETFSSMQYNNVIPFLDNIGCYTDLKANIYACNENPVFSMLFNVENDYTLPKIYAVKKSIFDYDYSSNNFVDNLNNLVLGMSGIDDIIIEEVLEGNNDGLLKYYNIREDRDYIVMYPENVKYIKINDNVYAYSLSDIPDKYRVLNLTTEINNIKSGYMTLSTGDEIEILYNDDDDNFNLYYVDIFKLDQLYDYLKGNSIYYDKYSDNFIEGNIEVDEDEIIFSTIPYDKDWSIYVDGSKVESSSLDLALLISNCNAGKHKIKFEYKENWTISIIISIITLFGILIGFKVRKYNIGG